MILNSKTNIFLVGLMGSGKTTIGRALAKRLGKRFVDADHEIEARTGASIPLIFEIEGEASFREREADVIRDLTAEEGIVLATGGGAILNADSRAFLKSRGTVVYLSASTASIMQRTSHDKNRPLLQTADPKARIEELSRQRSPLYQEVADIIIETGRPNVQSVVQNVLAQLEKRDASRAPAPVFDSIPDPTSAQTLMNQQHTVFAQLNVSLGERSYPIIIGRQLLDDSALAAHIPGKRIAIVTNTTVAPLYMEKLTAMLQRAGKSWVKQQVRRLAT